MRAVTITSPGGPEVLRIREVPAPEPFGEYVRVRVRAAGINRADLLQRGGNYPAPFGVPADIPGLEFAGEVDAVGPLVRVWRPGQRVFGLAGGGAQAEYILAHEGMLMEIPERLDFSEAAAIPEVFMTAHDALFTQANLRMGERVLIHAVGSGVGTAAVQLVRAAGARPFGTARTPEKLERARALGMEWGTHDRDFALRVREATGSEGVNVILDFVGSPYLEQNLQVLAPLGRLVFLATMGGTHGPINLGLLMSKRLQIRGSVLRSRSLEEKLSVTRLFATQVLPLVASGIVHPIVDQVYPMAEVAQAHRVMEENRNFGKLVLHID